jgi:enoyl-CoA hydratase/carnithine racemase
MTFPRLPVKAAYLAINNPKKRNALSLAVLRDLRDQLHGYMTSKKSGRLLKLPAFRPEILDDIEAGADEYQWLLSGKRWREEREGLPNILVLRSEGPVFSSGHDLKELAQLSHDEVKETFSLCAEVMGLIRHSPAPVVAPIQGLATAAGFQLAMTADYPITLANTPFRLPGATIGLPCTSPSTAISRRLGPGFAYRMLATADTVKAGDVNGSGFIDIVPVPEHAESSDTAAAAFDKRVAEVITQLATNTAGQPLALGKWAYWTQLGIPGAGGDGYEEAAHWAGRVMALHARAEDAKEGVAAFFEKRAPEWKT